MSFSTEKYIPHQEYSHRPDEPQRSQGFHRPFPPRSINLGVPLQPLRPVFEPSSVRREDWRPPNPQLPSPRIHVTPAPPVEEKQGFLTPPLRPDLKPLRTSLQCSGNPIKSQFSPYTRPHSATLRKAHDVFTKYFVEWWMLEIISWAFSAFCMAAILGVLSYYDDRELPQWFGGITLNGFISVFSGLAKAALLLPTTEALGQLKWNWFHKGTRALLDFEVLDAASRGPWGSLLLLGRLRRITLASIGAVIILAALPLDLFFQQVVMYPSIWIVVPSRPTVPRGITYLPPDQFSILNGNSALARDDFMKTVLEPTFYSNGTVPDLDIYCPTTNCTWEPFTTLGVCGACDNTVAQELSFGCYDYAADFLQTSVAGNTSTYSNVTSCGYWLNATSENRILMTGYAIDSQRQLPGEALQTRIVPLIDAYTRSAAYGDGSINFKSIKNPLVDFLVVNTPGGVANVYQNVTPVAHECVLHWCVQTVEASFFWGKLSENVSATWHNERKASDVFPWKLSMTENGYTEYEYLDNVTLTPPTTQMLHGKEITWPNTTFGLNNDTFAQAVFLLDDFAPSMITLDSASSGMQVQYEEVEMTGVRKRDIELNPWTNTSDHVQTMAAIMSAAVRSYAGNTGQIDRMEGTAWDLRVHVQIRWPWIILPLVLLALSLIFLVATVVKTTKEESLVGIFKNSALAILFNGVGDEVQRSVGPNCRMGQAREKASHMHVRLMPE